MYTLDTKPAWCERNLVPRFVAVAVASAVMAVVGMVGWIVLSLLITTSAGDSCLSVRTSEMDCDGPMGGALYVTAAVGLGLGWAAATVGPFLTRPRPQVQWIGIGIAVQSLTVLFHIAAVTIPR